MANLPTPLGSPTTSGIAQTTATISGTVTAVSSPPNSNIKSSITLVDNVVATKIPTVPLAARKSMTLINEGANTIYIGGSTVTSANGVPIPAGGSIGIGVGPAVDVYGLAATAPTNMAVLELS